MSGIIGVSPDMRSGVLGQAPKGRVLETKHSSNASVVTFSQTNNSYSDILTAITITLTNPSNAILVTAETNLTKGGGNYPALKCAVWWSIAGGTQNSVLHEAFTGYAGPNTENWYFVEPVLAYHLPASGAELTYRLVGTNSAGSTYSGTYAGSANQHAPAKSEMIVQEIQI